MIPSLELFLESKPLYYKDIDHNRIKVAFNHIKEYLIIPRVIHIVGTNGKGSTGRMVAYLLFKSGFHVGHYTSPHIIKFNERFWIDGSDCSNKELEMAHQKLYTLLDASLQEELSYFEYTTLLALFCFEKCEYIVLEAGLGGEWDATNVVPKILSIITPIDFDHQAFLGNTLEQIATTKLKSINKIAVIAPQVHDEVYSIARKLCKACELIFVTMDYKKEIESIARESGWGKFLQDNAKTALSALDRLGVAYNSNDLKSWGMVGRYYALRNNIRLDVGHNTLAAKALEPLLSQNTILIYNTYEDKPYFDILKTLKPKIKKLLIITIDSPRALSKKKLVEALEELGIEYGLYDGVLSQDENYLVFGSFSVVEAFLKGYK